MPETATFEQLLEAFPPEIADKLPARPTGRLPSLAPPLAPEVAATHHIW